MTKKMRRHFVIDAAQAARSCERSERSFVIEVRGIAARCARMTKGMRRHFVIDAAQRQGHANAVSGHSSSRFAA